MKADASTKMDGVKAKIDKRAEENDATAAAKDLLCRLRRVSLTQQTTKRIP